MKYIFEVEVEVKNNTLTQSGGRDFIAVLLKERIEESTGTLPWVLSNDASERPASEGK